MCKCIVFRRSINSQNKFQFFVRRTSEIVYLIPLCVLFIILTRQFITPDEIKDLLDGYKQVVLFSELKPFYHVRYYHKDKKTGEVQFKMGGTIIKINVEKQYVILSSGSLSWSVQKEGTVFYQAVPLSEMRAELEEKYKDEMQKITNDNNILMTYAKKLDLQVTELTNENNKLKTKLENFIKKTKK